jgi:hypothetical protein
MLTEMKPSHAGSARHRVPGSAPSIPGPGATDSRLALDRVAASGRCRRRSSAWSTPIAAEVTADGGDRRGLANLTPWMGRRPRRPPSALRLETARSATSTRSATLVGRRWRRPSTTTPPTTGSSPPRPGPPPLTSSSWPADRATGYGRSDLYDLVAAPGRSARLLPPQTHLVGGRPRQQPERPPSGGPRSSPPTRRCS